MQFKLPNTLSKILLSFLLLFISISRLEAYPDQERAALSSLLSSQATSMALESNKYLYVTYGTGIKRIDLSTWELATDQIPDLTDRTSSNGPNLTGTINGLAVKDRTLFATQSDGDIIIVDLDHVTSVPTTVHITSGSSGALGAVVADPETGTDDDKLYILDKATNGVYIYDISLQTASRFSLLDELAVSVAPTSLVFMANTDVPDKIFITSSAGLVFTIYEGTASVGGRTRLSPTSKELPSAALTPDNKFLLVVNSTDNKVHVIDAGSLLEVDTDTDSTSNKAILLPDNGSLKSISIINVTHPTDTYAYVTGANGVSVIDLNISNGTFDLPVSVLDFNHTGPSDTAYNPMAITSPGLITSTVDHNLITSNGNATFSVISDNPFVTIGSSSLGTGTLSSTGSYTLTFQSDEVGTYSVKVGGSLISSGTSAGAGTGTEVASGTISTADEDVTTSSISYNSSLYSEGENLIYIFVTDSNGNIGHDAKTITVDTPPPPVTITSTGFGNNFITVTFNRLTTSDLNHYNIYVATSASAVQTATTASATVSQPSSGSSVTATVSGLTNLTTYYVAIESVDNSGTASTRVSTYSDGATSVTAIPETTFGLLGAVGEHGCTLIDNHLLTTSSSSQKSFLLFFILTPLLLLLIRSSEKIAGKKYLFLIIALLLSSSLFADDSNPRHWTLELQGGVWQPTDATTKNYLGSCCDPLGKASFGYLFNKMLGVELGSGFIGSGGTSVGLSSGTSSNTRFNFSMIPISNDISFRGHFKESQLFIPYAKFGPDYVFFRENNQGNITKGWKTGLHGTIGVGFDLSRVDELSKSARDDVGMNDVYFIVESRYGWINGFGSSGVDLSGFTWTGGLLFEF